MSEKSSDRFQRHAAVDRLGGQRVPQAMRADVPDPGRRGDLGHGPVDAVLPDALAVFDEQVAAAQAGWAVGEPLVEEILELGVQGNVAVVAQLAQRHMQPVGGADLHHGIDCEIEEFTFAEAGAGQEFHTEAHERVGIARVACSSLVNAPSSRKRGNGSSRRGRSPANTSTLAGTSSPPHSVRRSKQVRSVPRCSARLVLVSAPPRAEGRVARCSL